MITDKRTTALQSDKKVLKQNVETRKNMQKVKLGKTGLVVSKNGFGEIGRAHV